MTVTNTSLLGLALPTTGTESGVWGDDVNNGLTILIDVSVAGTNNITYDGDVTLSVSNGSSSSSFASTTTTTSSTAISQYYILNLSGSRAAARNIIAPALSKSYLITNGTTGGYAITIKKTAGTGVAIAAGETALVYYNTVTADYVKASSIGTSGIVLPANGGTGVANGTNNTITFTGNYTLGLTLTGNTTATFPTSGYHIATVTNMAANPVTGTPSSSTYLRGDGTWATISTTSGTVTSVAMTVPSFLSVSGSPITSSGTLAVTLSGTALPIANGGTGSTSTTFVNLASNVTGTLPVANGGTNLTSFTSGGVVYASSTSALATGSALTFDGTNLYSTGNITAYYSSDIKFKENVQDIPDALGIVTAIGSKTFDWTDEYLKDHGGEDEYFQPKQSFGVIAQDVQKVFPQAVRTREDGSLAVDYEKLAVLSFGAIGQLLKRVEALEAK